MPPAESKPGAPTRVEPMDLLNLEHWIGVWSIDRRFDFETPGAPERFRGQATVQRVRPGLYLYSEEGVLEGIGSRPIHATQRYWIWPGEGESIELLFAPDPARPENAPPFTTLRRDPDGVLSGRHECGSDTYIGMYRGRGPDSLDIEWSVEGPRKKGRIISTLTRAVDEMGYA